MEPLDIYSTIQPLIKREIDNSIQKYADDRKFDVAQIPAHGHTGVDSETLDYNDLENRTRYILYRILSPTATATITNTVGGDFSMPFQGYVSVVGATVDTAGVTNLLTIRINKNGSTILLTNITIDSTEKTSRTAASLPVLDSTQSVNNFIVGDIFTFDITAIQTTPSLGLTIFMNVVETT